MKYPVACECGKTTAVEEGAAGTTWRCLCGRDVSIPTLGKLRNRAYAASQPPVQVSVECPCGKQVPINAAQANSAVACECGRFVSVPNLTPEPHVRHTGLFNDSGSEPRHKIDTAIVCFHIAAGLYALVGLVSFIILTGLRTPVMGLFMGVFCVGGAVLVEVVVAGLLRRRYWAWVVGVCLFALFVPSAFLPLGLIGIFALLDEHSQAEFGIRRDATQ